LSQIFRPKHFLGFKNFRNLLISIPKCIELNSESKPKLIFFGGFGLGSNPRPKPKIQRDPSQNVWSESAIKKTIAGISQIMLFEKNF